MDKLVLDQGADVAGARHDDFPALMFAAVDGHEAVAKLLLDQGADVTSAKHNGETAPVFAAAADSDAVADSCWARVQMWRQVGHCAYGCC